jgi:hypothetical protein
MSLCLVPASIAVRTRHQCSIAHSKKNGVTRRPKTLLTFSRMNWELKCKKDPRLVSENKSELANEDKKFYYSGQCDGKSYPLLLTVQSRQDSAVMVETPCGKKRGTVVYSGLSILEPTFNTSKPQSSHRNSQMYVQYKRVQHCKKFAGSTRKWKQKLFSFLRRLVRVRLEIL